MTPIDYAKERQYYDIVEILEKVSHNINSVKD